MDQTSDSAIKKRNQRRLVWKSYYNLLSEILQLKLPSYPALAPIPQATEKVTSSNNRAVQYLELKKVEAAYESILFRDVSFPEASKVNHEVDEWVDTVMSNWSTLCGPEWQSENLGEDGKVGVGRNALNVWKCDSYKEDSYVFSRSSTGLQRERSTRPLCFGIFSQFTRHLPNSIWLRRLSTLT